jgi:zinc transport system permease protein
MIEALSLPFMQHAFIAAFLVSICIGIIGSLVVVNRMVFLAGGIAHGSYGGIGIAIYLGILPIIGAGVFATLLAFLIALISYKNTERMDPIIGAMWAAGMSIGIIFIDLTPGYNVDIMSYLFGSIISVSSSDLWIMGGFDALILFLVSIFHKDLLAMSFDSEFAKLRGVKEKLLYYLLIVLIGISVIVTIRAVGLILVIALMSIPPFMAEKFSPSLYKMMYLSTVFTLVFTFSGLFVSYAYNISSGATIILIASIVFFLYLGISKSYKLFR